MIYELAIPLFFRVHEVSGNGGFPDVYPFRMRFDGGSGVPVQDSSAPLRDILRKVYAEGLMMVGSMDGGDLAGGIHAADCMAFTREALPQLQGRRILEIGCGRGVILSQLARQGAHCVGLEPGKQIRDAKAEGVRLINDFFPSSQLAGERFDAVTSYNVIEHIEDLTGFLEGVRQCLAEGGDFVFCVPNCGPYLAAGDVSILLHEHFNYFSSDNVVALLEGAGFTLDKVTVSASTALLMVHARKGRQGAAGSAAGVDELGHFMRAMQGVQDRLGASMSRFEDREIAVYCPNRALNVMCQLGRRMVRLVEDTPGVAGRYYPYFGSPVESFASLAEHPPKSIYVFSFTHGELLRARCRGEARLEGAEVHVISDFY